MRIIILAAILAAMFSSCMLPEMAMIPEDFAPWHKQDTTASGIVQDTMPCDSGIITIPLFVTLSMELDAALPASPKYTHSWLQDTFATVPELLIALGFHQDSIESYIKDSVAFYVIRGTNDNSKINGRIFVRDEHQQKYALTASVQYLVTVGACTFEEHLDLAVRLQSVNGFNFRRCNYTQAQIEEIAKTILGECKHGRYWADFRFNLFPISDELYCLFIERGWIKVLGQMPNCGQPQPVINKPLRA